MYWTHLRLGLVVELYRYLLIRHDAVVLGARRTWSSR